MAESINEIVSRLKKQKIENWEIYFQNSLSNHNYLRRNETELIHSTNSLGYGIRIHNGGMGFGVSNLIKPHAIDNLIQNVSSSAKLGKKIKFTFPTNQKTKKVKNVDKKLQKENSEKTLLDFSKQLIDLVKEKNLEVSFAKLKAFDISTQIINSEGLEKSKNETYFYIELSLKAEREFWINNYSRRIEDISINKINQWIENAKNISKGIIPKTEKTTVIFTPKVMVDAIVPVLDFHSVASSLKTKVSYFLHTKNFSKDLTIVDDGLYPFANNTSPFDDEGNPQRKNIIIKNGIFKNYLFDQFYGSILNKKSTGNGLRQKTVYPLIDDKYTTQPYNQPSNLIILPGKKKIENLISEIDKGILINVFSWLAPHEETGLFSSEIRNATYIENGELTKPIKGGAVSGNIFDLLNNISGISKEFEIVSGATAFSGAMPYVRFDNIQVAGI